MSLFLFTQIAIDDARVNTVNKQNRSKCTISLKLIDTNVDTHMRTHARALRRTCTHAHRHTETRTHTHTDKLRLRHHRSDNDRLSVGVTSQDQQKLLNLTTPLMSELI